MRLIQLGVPRGRHEAVIDLLEQRGLTYVVSEETSHREFSDIVFVLAETESVESITDDLRALGIERDGHIIVSSTEAVLSERVEREPENEDDSEEADRISRDELQTMATEMTEISSGYLIFSVVSAVVATIGLLIDSAAVVVGSMVIAPLLGPAIGASVGTIVGDEELFAEGLRAQVLGLGMAIISAALFAAVARMTIFPQADIRVLNQVAQRVNPGVLSLVVALGSGAAGALSITAGMSTALVGVMIAAALIPPAATVGLGIAYLDPILAVSATILVLVNVLSINFATIGVLWVQGYRPDHWFGDGTVRSELVKRAGVLGLGILVLSSFLVVSSVDAYRNTQFENAVDDAALTSDARVISVDVTYETQLFSRQPESVVIRTAGPAPELVAELERIRNQTGSDVTFIVVSEDATVSEGGNDALPAARRSSALTLERSRTRPEPVVGGVDRTASSQRVRKRTAIDHPYVRPTDGRQPVGGPNRRGATSPWVDV